jgi:hypothetical protein
MAHRSIEEVIQTIAPSRQPGIPNPPTIGVGVSSDNGDLTAALSQAGQQITQLQSAYQQQANLITENTQALQGNTSSKLDSAGSVLGGVASSLFGGALGFLSPIVSGIASLFGGSSAPQALPIYTPPPPVSIGGVLQATPVPQQAASSSSPSQGAAAGPSSSAGGSQGTYAPQITVNVSAMDSQSFLDRSDDIASAVREAMLNMHPINNVVAEL